VENLGRAPEKARTVSVKGHLGENDFVPIRYLDVTSRVGLLFGGKAARGTCSVIDGVRWSVGVVEVGSCV
jgi:hypothetical protein